MQPEKDPLEDLIQEVRVEKREIKVGEKNKFCNNEIHRFFFKP